MSSIWLEAKGKAPFRAGGGMPPPVATAQFEIWLPILLQSCQGKVVHRDGEMALIAMKDGITGIAYVEHLSPASAPEVGQPKRHAGVDLLKLPNGETVLIDLGWVK